MHTGDAEERDGDYYGTAVNRAARLMAAAHGGQILVSLATEELARDTLDDGMAFVDLGEHRLRDLSRPERVFQVLAPGLPDEFPALSSVGECSQSSPVPSRTTVIRVGKGSRAPAQANRMRGPSTIHTPSAAGFSVLSG